MNESSSSFVCDPNGARDYLADELPDQQQADFESHLEQCGVCRDRLLEAAGDDHDWRLVCESLDDDPYDVDGQSIGDVVCSDASELLLREIQGWLDPTDDPRMLGRFGGYEVSGIIGAGGMGIVLKGFEIPLNRYVAIKVMAPRLASSGTAKKRFQREAEAAAAVLHDNVIAIHRVGEAHGLPFLVMPYINGETLQQRINQRGPLPANAALRIASQIAAGLSAAHEQGLIHRDIKPANILLGPGTDRVTITDFGLARAAGEAGMTRTGVIAGTPEYMSPEQTTGETVDARSDLFSLGSVMYAMLAGRPPFRDEDIATLLVQIRSQRATPLRQIKPSVPDWLQRLVVRLMTQDLRRRCQTAEDVRHLIDACLLHLHDQSNPLPPEVDSEPKSRRPALIMLLVFLMLVVVGIWVAFSHNHKAVSTSLSPPTAQPAPVPLHEIDSDLSSIEMELDDIERNIPIHSKTEFER